MRGEGGWDAGGVGGRVGDVGERGEVGIEGRLREGGKGEG